MSFDDWKLDNGADEEDRRSARDRRLDAIEDERERREDMERDER
jgi:hypothetical protein